MNHKNTILHLFYTPDIKKDAATYTLNGEESKHCIKVLRMGNGDMVHLVDGKGGYYKAVITEPDQRQCMVRIVENSQEYGKEDFYLHIAIAPTKSIDKFEWFLEKVTEIGINEITPLYCRYSERKSVKPERLSKIITSAIKQSVRAYHPVLNEMKPFGKFVSNDFTGKKLIAHCNPCNKKSIRDVYNPGENALILIGPEGGFSEEEVKAAKKNKYDEVMLGTSRLRTETAGVVACHSINFINN